MKVTAVTVTAFAGGCVVELLTDVGLTGIGVGDAGTEATIKAVVNDVVIGADPRSVTGLWQRIVANHEHRRARPSGDALAAVDIALWDLKAKANDEPLWKTLGSARPRANAHASCLDPTLQDAALLDWFAAMARDYGMRAGKLRVGSDQAVDLQRIERMHAALARATTQPTLIVDADQQWSPKQAIRRLREIEERFDLACAEAVARTWDVHGSKQVSNAIRGAVCVGHGLASLAEFLPHFRDRSADIVQIDIGATGITTALQLADAAFGYELPVTLSAVPGNIHAHLAGAMPYFMSLEVVDPVPCTQLYSTDVWIEQGRAVVGDRPGHGLVVNHEALAAATRSLEPR